MVNTDSLARNVPSLALQPNAIAMLERLRDSYRGLLERDALTGADQAVLSAVEMTLKHAAGTI
jgi:hypothetical protein